MTNEEKLQARIQNTERALVALWSLLEDLQPAAYSDDINLMMEQYHNAGQSLGSEAGTEPYFITGDNN